MHLAPLAAFGPAMLAGVPFAFAPGGSGNEFFDGDGGEAVRVDSTSRNIAAHSRPASDSRRPTLTQGYKVGGPIQDNVASRHRSGHAAQLCSRARYANPGKASCKMVPAQASRYRLRSRGRSPCSVFRPRPRALGTHAAAPRASLKAHLVLGSARTPGSCRPGFATGARTERPILPRDATCSPHQV